MLELYLSCFSAVILIALLWSWMDTLDSKKERLRQPRELTQKSAGQ